MSKIKLILKTDQFTSFASNYLENFWREHFDIEWFDNTKQYDIKSTVFLIHYRDIGDDYITHLNNSGYKIVVEDLWEIPIKIPGFRRLQNNNWFWYNESLWWRSLQYHNVLDLDKTLDFLALVPLRRPNAERDLLVKKLQPWLNKCIWSYQDRRLPNDVDSADGNFQRYVNPDWYKKTCMSVVSETAVTDAPWPTEKIFKPIAYGHPFVVLGTVGILKYIKSLGFETFENLFDESYDDTNDLNQRLDKIVDNISQFNTVPYDKLTRDKLKHNHYLFFDEMLVKNRIIKEIVEPLIEYAET